MRELAHVARDGTPGKFLPFLSSCFSFSLFLFFSLLSVVHKIRNYHGYIHGVIWLRVIRDGIPQLVRTVSLTDWYDTAV